MSNSQPAATPETSASKLDLKDLLDYGLRELGLVLPARANLQLFDYLDLLQRWNRTYSLTAIHAPRDMLVQHLLDSLALLPVLVNSAWAEQGMSRFMRVADVGSGAGLPGVPMAIACPQWHVTTIDAVEKKSAFQRQVKIELALPNLQIAAMRVEQMPPGDFDIVVSRAFASLADFVALAGHLVCEGGVLCAMKGVQPDKELAQLPSAWTVDAVKPVRVPGLAAQRHVVFLRKT